MATGSCLALLAAAGCAEGHAATAPARPSAAATALVTKALAARYLRIATPANKRLDHDFDRLDDLDHAGAGADLAGARADLRDIAATETRCGWSAASSACRPLTPAYFRV